MAYQKERLQEIIRNEVSMIIERDFRIPGTLITVLGTEVTADRQHAVVFYSVYPTEKSDEIIRILGRAIGSIQYRINRSLPIRPVPKIRFVRDDSAEEASRIEVLARQSLQSETLAQASQGLTPLETIPKRQRPRSLVGLIKKTRSGKLSRHAGLPKRKLRKAA